MNSGLHRRAKDALRVELYGLTKACPFHQSNPEDCPLYLLRKMKPAQRRRWFNALNEESLRYLAAYHQVCLKIKMESERREQK